MTSCSKEEVVTHHYQTTATSATTPAVPILFPLKLLSHTTAGREVRAESDLNVYGENLVGGAAEPGFHQWTRIKQHIRPSHSHFLTTPAHLQVFSPLCSTHIACKLALVLAEIINLWEVLTRLSPV